MKVNGGSLQIWKSGLWLLVIVAGLACVAVVVYIPGWVPQHPTGPVNAMLNNLRKIEGAKDLWAAKHGTPENAAVSAGDLAPFLPVDFWSKTVAGERYLINRHAVPPEAVLTRKVEDLPAGTRLHFGEDGKVEIIRPGKARGQL